MTLMQLSAFYDTVLSVFPVLEVTAAMIDNVGRAEQSQTEL